MKFPKSIALATAAVAVALGAVAVGPSAAPAEAADCMIIRNANNNSAQSGPCRPSSVPEPYSQHRIRVVCERGTAAYVYYGAWQPLNRYSTAFCPAGYSMIGASVQQR